MKQKRQALKSSSGSPARQLSIWRMNMKTLSLCLITFQALLMGHLTMAETSVTEVVPWQLNSISPSDQTVSAKTDLEWVFSYNGKDAAKARTIEKGDCIRIVLENPYLRDAATSYQSFDVEKAQTDRPVCEFKSGHVADCDIIDAQTFTITFAESSSNTLIEGRTTSLPFQNPYSARLIRQAQTSLIPNCELESTPLVEGKAKVTSFSTSKIDEEETLVESSSLECGITDAELTVKFKPASVMKASGRISLKVPAWYYQTRFTLNPQESPDSMLDHYSEVQWVSHEHLGYQFEFLQFQQASRSYLMIYTGPEDITDEVELKFSLFKNPVNTYVSKGFQISTMDYVGYLIDQSDDDLQLKNKMEIPATLNSKTLYLHGAPGEDNDGRVGELNSFQILINSAIPFEQYCYFTFQFPPKLQITESMALVQGSGIFQPTQESNVLNSNQYSVDYEKNQILVEGCRLANTLSAAPIGTITFSMIKLPDYIVTTDPIQVFGYSDNARQDQVIDDPIGVPLDASQMQPGLFYQMLFKPSSLYAYTDNVSYTIYARPQHNMKPDSRIIIEMPPHLIFDQERGCEVALTLATCVLDASTNTITLTDIFEEEFEGGNLMKFIIVQATNPSGARPAGPWSIRSEQKFDDGKYYVVDGEVSPESFFARSGTIESSMTHTGIETFAEGTELAVSISTEHNIPDDGYIVFSLPDSMKFDSSVTAEGRLEFGHWNMDAVNVTDSTATFALRSGHSWEENPIDFVIRGVRNPRSFTPTSGFVISSTDNQGYIIDQGGEDLSLTMVEMNELENIQLVPMNTTNGAVTTYEVYLDSFVELKDADIVYITFPPEISFSEDLNCSSGESGNATYGIGNARCIAVGQKLIANIYDLDKSTGRFIFDVNGVKNPPSFRPTSLFSDISMQTDEFYPIQQVEDYSELFIVTDQVGRIWEYVQFQFSEKYAEESAYHLTFKPQNRIGSDGIMILTWTDQVEVHEESVCTVQTYKQFDDPAVCVIYHDLRKIRIEGAFKEQESYAGSIGIEVTRIKNPYTNKGLKDFTIETYDDVEKKYPIDIMRFQPLLECNWPCQTCGITKTTCTGCWQNEEDKFLMVTEEEQTCKTACDDGWTRNGNPLNICERCSSRCATCEDKGLEGDNAKCTSCAPGHDFSFEDDPYACMRKCPAGFYETGDKICRPCSSNCYSCVGDANTCTSCKFDSPLKVLQGTECVAECSAEQADVGGVCTDCESPCATCSASPSHCTSCDGSNGLIFTYGPTCVESCPNGTKENTELSICEGCDTGCDSCDATDQRVCLVCNYGLLMVEGKCVRTCPDGYIANYGATYCISEGDLDLQLVYFPFLITTAVLFVLSAIGAKSKKKHRLLTNFIVPMGLLLQVALITQIVLTFKFGTWRYNIVIWLAWLLYVAGQPLFQYFFTQRIIKEDKLYQQWRARPSNLFAKQFMNICGAVISWKFYKLLYSHFWGYTFKYSEFSQPHVFENLQKYAHLYNIGFTYLPVIILNIVGCVDLSWGTQLYIMMIENLIICTILSILGVVEWFLMRRYLALDSYKPVGKQGEINLMNAIEDSDFSEVETAQQKSEKLKQKLLQKTSTRNAFIDRKFEELIALFGNRQCRSACLEINSKKEPDPRRVRTYPGSPHLPPVKVDDPPKPLADPYPDNCYHEAKPSHLCKKVGVLGEDAFHKGVQCGGLFDGDMLRLDAGLVSDQANPWDTIKSEYSHKKKYRGRKNRYFRQIENEDNDAGMILDSDEEGQKANDRARESHVDKQAQLEAIKEVEELRAQKKKDAERRRKAHLENEKILSEENLKLKQQLERQREIDLIESQEFKRRIELEEKKRQDILMSAENNLKRIEDEKAKMQQMMEDEEARKRAAYEEEQAKAIEQARLEKEEFDRMQKQQIDASSVRKSKDSRKSRKSLIDSNRSSQKAKSGRNKSNLVSRQNTEDTAAMLMDTEGNEPALKDSISPGPKGSINDATSFNKSYASNNPLLKHGGMSDLNATAEVDEEGFEDGQGDFRNEVNIRQMGANSVDGLTNNMSAAQLAALKNAEKDSADVSAFAGQTTKYGVSTQQSQGPTSRRGVGNPQRQVYKINCIGSDGPVNMDSINALFNELPRQDLRNFNEIDICGYFDRDAKGNLILEPNESVNYDYNNEKCNQQGYLIDPKTGDLVNINGVKFFNKKDLDDRGNLPLPHSVEKFNFNPFDLQGDLTFEDLNDPMSFNKAYKGGKFIDNNGNLIQLQGFLQDQDGNIVDRYGRKRFDYSQFEQFGNLMPKLYNYNGKQFEIHDVMGVFNRNSDGKIDLVLNKDENGYEFFTDLAGNRVNHRGYLINKVGDIITRLGKVIFKANSLKNGEFPKIFPFTRFNIKRVLGTFEMDPGGNPILTQDENGNYRDKNGRLVNAKGYLINENGDVVDRNGNVMFELCLSDEDGEIPEIFRMNLLRSDSASSLSRLMDEIEEHQPDTMDADDAAGETYSSAARRRGRKGPGRAHGESEASLHSMMEENYNLGQERYSMASAPEAVKRAGKKKYSTASRWNKNDPQGGITEEFDEERLDSERHSKRRRKKKRGPQYIEEITGRDILMASAYGGVAKPRIRKANHRFQTVARERVGVQTSAQPKRAVKVGNLLSGANSNAKSNPYIPGTEGQDGPTSEVAMIDIGDTKRSMPVTKSRQNYANQTQSALNGSDKNLDINENQKLASARVPGIKKHGLRSGGKTTESPLKQKRIKIKKGKEPGNKKSVPAPQPDKQFEDEFEKLYKKDIDQFIDGSDFEEDSLGNLSQISKRTYNSAIQNTRMRGLEKVYLQRLDLNPFHEKPVPKNKKKPTAKRQLQDRFCDDPKYVARGEMMRFEVGDKSGGSSTKRKAHNASGIGLQSTAQFGASPQNVKDSATTPKNLSNKVLGLERAVSPNMGQQKFRANNQSDNYFR